MIDRLSAPWILRVAQIVTGLVFLAAGLSKLGDLPSFALQVHNYRVLPIWSEHLVAMTVPWIELVAGLALVLGVRPRAGALVATCLLGVFTLAVAAAWVRGLDFECGCFGKASASRIGLAKLAENGAYLLVAAVAVLRPRGR
jgi:uncharacterized membrane protein YphA (DoxX/SURF4 family)